MNTYIVRGAAGIHASSNGKSREKGITMEDAEKCGGSDSLDALRGAADGFHCKRRGRRTVEEGELLRGERHPRDDKCPERDEAENDDREADGGDCLGDGHGGAESWRASDAQSALIADHL